MVEHKPLVECVAIHTALQKDAEYTKKILEEIRSDVKGIRAKLEQHTDRLWQLYVKIVVMGALSGGGAASIFKFIL